MKKNMLYWVLGVIVLVMAASVIAANWLITEPEEGPEVTEDFGNQIQGENVTFTITEKGKKKWELRVKSAIHSKDDETATLEGISGEFYNAHGEPVATFNAPKGRYAKATKAVTLSADGDTPVTVQTIAEENGAKLSAPTVEWSSKTDWIVAKDGVSITMGGYATSKAAACRFALDFSSVSLEGGAHSEIAM